MNASTTWLHLWFGCWAEFGEQYAKCPSIKEFIDPSWHYEKTEQLTNYLSTAPLVATTSRLALPWAIGSGDGRSSVSYRSDGVWLWLDDLDYYINQQNLRLPSKFISHIEENNFIPPQKLNKDSRELPWPVIG